MKQKLLLIFIFLTAGVSVNAQFESVQYDFSKNWFGENEKLPAETSWMLSGELPPGISTVAVEIYGSAQRRNPPLHRSVWTRASSEASASTFYIPVNYNLRSSSKYTIELKYYRKTTLAEMESIRQQVYEAASSYLELNIIASRNDVDLRKNPKMMVKDLNKLMEDGLVLFQSDLNRPFPGFSNLVEDQLKNMDELNLKKGKFNILKKDSVNSAENDRKIEYFKSQLENLKQVVKREIDQYLSNDFSILEISRVVPDYKTEHTRTVIPVNVGYGVVHNKGGIDGDFDYDASPYVGISFPLANPNFSGKFWSNSSLSAGVFVNNFAFDNGMEYTGPLLGRPFYVAYGYKTAYFIRFNLGATILENTSGNTKPFVRPFIGASIEINLWMGLSR